MRGGSSWCELAVIAAGRGARMPAARAEVAPGTMLDQVNGRPGEGPPAARDPTALQERRLHEPGRRLPERRFRWDDGFDEATKQNGETLDARRAQAAGRQDHRQAARLHHRACRSRTSARTIPTAATRSLWNLAYAYYTGGNSHNWTMLNWMSRTGVERASVQDVYFLYYDGQPRQYSPTKNPENLLFQFLARDDDARPTSRAPPRSATATRTRPSAT